MRATLKLTTEDVVAIIKDALLKGGKVQSISDVSFDCTVSHGDQQDFTSHVAVNGVSVEVEL